MISDDINLDRLSALLKALAHPARLELLRLLRHPAAPGDLSVHPRRRDAALEPDRAMSRQAIAEHLVTMEQAGIVTRLEGEGEAAAKYVTSAQHVFALVEELRILTAVEPSTRLDVDETLAQRSIVAPSWPAGPRLVLLGGPWEGRAFALAGVGPWTVGRSRGCDVALSYDPYASAEHMRIDAENGKFVALAGSGTRNATRVNFVVLDQGLRRALALGDVITVGRSHLVFQP